MPSTFSTSIRLELIATGEAAGTWGTTTNTNLGTLLEQAVTGVGSIVMTDADLTLTAANGVTDQARNAVLVVTSSTLTVTRALILPNVPKTYTVFNATTGSQAITVKTSAGTGVTIPNGNIVEVYCNGAGVTTQRSAPYNPTTNRVGGGATGAGWSGTTGAFSDAVAFTVNPTVAGNAIWHAGNFTPGTGGTSLGFTPVQQGTGIGQLTTNTVKIGWTAASRLKATVDTTDLGNMVFDSHLASYLLKTGGALSGPLTTSSTLTVGGNTNLQALVGTTATYSSTVFCASPRNGGGGRTIVDSSFAFGPWAWNSGGGYIEVDAIGSLFGINVFVSDERRKDDIAPSADPVLPLIRQIDFIDFRFKPVGAPEGTVMPYQRGGVSAQQIRPIREEWVQELKDGTLMPNVQLLLTNALKGLQELDREVQALRAEVTALRA